MNEITCHKCGDELNYIIGCGYSATYECGFCGFIILIAHQSGGDWDKPSGRYRWENNCCMMCDNIIPQGETMCSISCRAKWDKKWEDLKNWD